MKQSLQLQEKLENKLGDNSGIRYAVSYIVRHMEKEKVINRIRKNNTSINKNLHLARMLKYRQGRLENINDMLNSIEKEYGKKARDFTLNKSRSFYKSIRAQAHHTRYTSCHLPRGCSLGI